VIAIFAAIGVCWDGKRICSGVGNISILHGYNLGHNPEEGDLEARSDADEDFSTDESIDWLCGSSEYATKETQNRANDEESATTKDIGQATDKKKISWQSR
jgi:hypothetical protein